MASIIDERMYRLNEAMVMAARVNSGRTRPRGSPRMEATVWPWGASTEKMWMSMAKYRMSSVPSRNDGMA